MSRFFATLFPNVDTALEAQRLVERIDDELSLRLVSSVVIVKDAKGGVTQHDGSKPGAIGAIMTGLIGGILGLLGGPAIAAMGAAGGTISGAWFDLLRDEDRQGFMNEVARAMNANDAVLLGEVADPSDEAKQAAEARLTELGGVLIGKRS